MEESNDVHDQNNINLDAIYEGDELDGMASWSHMDESGDSFIHRSSNINRAAQLRKKKNLFHIRPLKFLTEGKEVSNSETSSNPAVDYHNETNTASTLHDIYEPCYSVISNNEISRLTIDLFLSELSSLNKYLSSDWSYAADEVQEEAKNTTFKYIAREEIKEAVDRMTSELTTYVLSYATAYLNSYCSKLEDSSHPHFSNTLISDINSALIEAIKINATSNATYCEKILRWLILKYSEAGFTTEKTLAGNFTVFHESLLQEYYSLAPGPWRDAVLLAEMLRTSTTLLDNDSNNNTVEPSSLASPLSPPTDKERSISPSVTKSDVDVDSDEVRSVSVSGDTVNPLFNSNTTTTTQRRAAKDRDRNSGARVSRLQSQIALLEAALEKARAVDIEQLQGEVRGLKSDIRLLRDRNRALSQRYREAETKLWSIMRVRVSPSASDDHAAVKVRWKDDEESRIRPSAREDQRNDDVVVDDEAEDSFVDALEHTIVTQYSDTTIGNTIDKKNDHKSTDLRRVMKLTFKDQSTKTIDSNFNDTNENNENNVDIDAAYSDNSVTAAKNANNVGYLNIDSQLKSIKSMSVAQRQLLYKTIRTTVDQARSVDQETIRELLAEIRVLKTKDSSNEHKYSETNTSNASHVDVDDRKYQNENSVTEQTLSELERVTDSSRKSIVSSVISLALFLLKIICYITIFFVLIFIIMLVSFHASLPT